MKSLSNKHFYKGISLFIKTMILAFSFWYIWKKITETDESIGLDELMNVPLTGGLLLASLLVFLNWGIEALKWKLLIRPLEPLPYMKCLYSILTGVTISIFSPNRIGEFAGRIFFLEKADKVKATIASMLGSMIQLAVTIVAGLLAYFILQRKYDFFKENEFTSPVFFPVLIGGIVLFSAILVFLYVKRNTLFLKYRSYIEVIGQYPKKELNKLITLSVLRYLVFSFQYYLILQLFGINAGITILFALIALTFFVTSAIPTFALTEIAVRGATAAFFFGTISNDTAGIIAASMLLWIINLVIPALLGSLFIWKLKFFKT